KFAEFVNKHKDKLQESFDELGKKPAASDAVLKELVAMLENEFEVSMRDESAELLRTVKEGNIGWRALKHGQDLGEEGKLDRRVWQLGRRLYLQETAPDELAKFDKTQALPHAKKEPPNTAIAAVIDSVDAEKKMLTATVRELNKDVAKSFKLGDD